MCLVPSGGATKLQIFRQDLRGNCRQSRHSRVDTTSSRIIPNLCRSFFFHRSQTPARIPAHNHTQDPRQLFLALTVSALSRPNSEPWMSRLPNWGKIINMSLKLADTSSIMHVANLASDYHSQSMLSALSHLFGAKLISTTSTYGVLSQLPVINAVSTEYLRLLTEYEVPQHKAPHAEPASIVNIHTTLGPMPSCILQHRNVYLTVGKYNFAAVCGHSYPSHLSTNP